uniref:Lipoprotein n=1 Tax=Panagrolaimus davidi TaxID=227884 RepID=A0A914PKJ6_9BILA
MFSGCEMPQIPFGLEWTIPAYSLFELKNTTNCLLSTSISNIPEFEYYLSIFPNGFNEKNRGKTWIGLQLELKDVKQVKADYKIIIESETYSVEKHVIYENSTGSGEFIAGMGEFFSKGSNFISYGKLTIKIHGFFKFERKTNIPFGVKEFEFNSNKLWKNNDKHFTRKRYIIVENKEIKVSFLKGNGRLYKRFF